MEVVSPLLEESPPLEEPLSVVPVELLSVLPVEVPVEPLFPPLVVPVVPPVVVPPLVPVEPPVVVPVVVPAVLEEVLGEEQAADAFVTLTKDLVVTPKEMDEELLHLADVMAAALNRALHPDFDRL